MLYRNNKTTMGRNYYCEFCDRSFADILSIRKKHIKSLHHQRMRKLHYDSFKDAATILQEEAQKKPCNRFFQTGHCDFGDKCRFSHTNLNNLKQQLHQKQETPRKAISHDEIDNWLTKWKMKYRSKEEQAMNYKLPAGFPPPHQLPPSLQPPLPDCQLGKIDWG